MPYAACHSRILTAIGLVPGGQAAAASSTPILATAAFDGEPVQATYGDIIIRLIAGPQPKDESPEDAIAEVSSPAGTIRLALSDDGPPESQVRIICLAPGLEPQVLFQHAAVGSSACVKSKLAVLVNGTWWALDLHRVCEAEDG